MAAAVVNAASPSTGFICSHTHRRESLLSSPPVFFGSRNPRSFLCRSIPLTSHWNGLKNLGISPRRNCRRKEKKGKCRGRVVYASLFGVGAPEALVIGVVALLVFGPKGLAEVARNLGKTLRAFQPTIRELQEVSREFKSTLEREIGLNEVASSTNDIYKSTSPLNQNQQSTIDPNGNPTTKAYSSEELLRITEEQLAASAIRPQTKSSSSDAQTKATPEAAASSSVPPEVATTQIPSSAPPEVTTDQIPSSSSEKVDIDR